MKHPIKRLIPFAAALALTAGLSAAATANPFVVDAGGAGLSLAEGCLVSESFCDPGDANQVTLTSAAVATGTFSFSALTPGPQTLTFSLGVGSASLDRAGNPTVDQIELTNLLFAGTVNVTVSNSFVPGLVDIALVTPASVTASGDIEIFQGGGSLGSTPFSVPGVDLTSLNCTFFQPVTGGLCGITAAAPGTLNINVGGQDISLESFAFNPTLTVSLPEPTTLALIGIAGLALIGFRRRA